MLTLTIVVINQCHFITEMVARLKININGSIVLLLNLIVYLYIWIVRL